MASEFITFFHVISPATHLAALHSAPALRLLCNAHRAITLSMNHECKLINIIGTDALGLQFHFPFIRSSNLGKHHAGTSNQQCPLAAFVLLNEDASLAGAYRDRHSFGPIWEFSNNLPREMHSAFLEGFPGTVSHLTMVENTVFHQDLPHAHRLSSGVNTRRLLQHPVHQFGPHTALPKGRWDTKDGKSHPCRCRCLF